MCKQDDINSVVYCLAIATKPCFELENHEVEWVEVLMGEGYIARVTNNKHLASSPGSPD